ncbi:putative PepSY-like beta-lactamase-inhibitor [Chitinophaga skermanii]|uniref:Putative PepSY-like beta-lactamase-inhibitor n=1 Tax=Chitinophaga skermanii TaxID=331697 RepID=A0A327QY54_9BACT|nr:PepSY-like domain-containing protein [Chitinophaga skermanii]RAJ06597.1 putative PepSY-like beta-lactamase-inhibitor [Chitinophaga skermanii]
MKLLKCTLAAVLFVLFAGTTSLHAQEQTTILEATRINKEQLPKEVIDAYKKKFPSANLKQIMKLPTSVYKKDWQIDEQNPMSPNDDYYYLSMTGKTVDIEAVYDRNGNLVRANETATNMRLPASINKYIGDNYQGWRPVKDKVKRIIEPQEISSRWEVKIASANKATKRLLFDGQGNYLGEK